MKTINVLGHPVHQALIPIPLGLFAIAAVFDLVYALTDYAVLGTTAYWNLVAGIIGAVIAAAFGAMDWWQIPPNTRAKRVGALHGGGNLILVGLLLVSVLSRSDHALHLPTTGLVILEVLALMLAGVTGWLGGELVNRLGVGVAEGANLNAASSLSRAHR